VGNTQYVDSKLTQLNAPQADALELASVLEDSSIGGFDAVDVLLNEPAAKVKQSIELLFRDKTKDDLLLLYFSGHGIKDESARLYLTTTDTRPDFVRSTGISAGFLKESMQGSNSQRKVLVLDCCYSGAFVQGAKASAAIGSRIYSGSEFLSGGYGQVVITSSDTMEYAWEGDKVIGSTDNSYFTHYLIEGLRTGQADDDKDGLISLTELYEYAYRHVINKQTPSMSASEMKGQIFLARNPRPVVRPDALPPELLSSLKSTHTWQKEGAILELGRFLGSSDTTAANTARHYLRQLARDDSRKVSDSAQRVLARYEGNTRLSDQERPPERSMSRKASARNVQSNVGSPRLEQPLGSTKDQAGNTSGMGNISVVPNEIKRKWNWGAFLLSWIWGMGNGTWIAMFVFVPYVGWIMPFLLGLKGNEWAWKNRQWDNIEHFQSVQKKWRKWSFIVYAVATVMFMCFLLFAGSM
jgi:hypothetical protein